MNCIKDQCRSPVACRGFGYCRERNFGGSVHLSQEEVGRIVAALSMTDDGHGEEARKTRDLIARLRGVLQ
ncbi:hypothetical protein [Bradyrhizobium lablabi]|uniref:hypothetical protein n=1 Tax=Bradyrhizobium lablabi TaxID=722472 RepID=UPI001BAA1CED|nr:hypothetical protein [Bradyrhizobium lablabi]MBR0693632.1 hypothetical protein [Bradyrhizobium lablabi]